MSTEPNTGAAPIVPWYRHPWLWFVIAIPTLAVVFSLHFVYLAVVHRDAVVRDDWYEDGKSINNSAGGPVNNSITKIKLVDTIKCKRISRSINGTDDCISDRGHKRTSWRIEISAISSGIHNGAVANKGFRGFVQYRNR